MIECHHGLGFSKNTTKQITLTTKIEYKFEMFSFKQAY